MSSAGGLLNGLKGAFGVLVSIFCAMSSKAQLIDIIFRKKIDPSHISDTDCEETKKVVAIHKIGF